MRPLSYEAELVVSPGQDRFTGHIAITAQLTEPTSFIWLNASRIDVKKVTVQIGAKTYPARASPGGRDYVGIKLSQIFGPGRVVATIDYEGVIERSDTDGLFHAREGDDWYAFSNSRPISARRVFPCFDEPGWKTPWKLSLVIPTADVAVANAPAIGEDALPGSMKRVRFAASPPLSSQHVAFAVGPFDVVDGGRAGRRGVALRYFVPRGRATEARFAQRATPRLLESIEEYVDAPLPFEKLDVVAVPVPGDFMTDGNPGLIATSADLILMKPEQENSSFEKNYVADASQALARQWFGGLVTAAWWDDLWLNESLSRWMSSKVTQRFNAEWVVRLRFDEQRQVAAERDRLLAAHALRQSVDSDDDLIGAFESSASTKGSAVLRMFETWLGEDRFRAAVRRYLAGGSFKSARSEDFLNALTAEAGDEQNNVRPAFRSLVERPGVPELDVALTCPPAGKGAPRLELAQQRYAPAQRILASGSVATPASSTWVFPACFQYGEGGDFGEQCVVVRDARQIMPLPDDESCPDWIIANRDGTSYMVPILKDPLDGRLENAPLLPDEAVAVIGDARILSASRDMLLDQVLALAARFSTNRQPAVAQAAVGLVEDISPSWLAAPDDREHFSRYVRAEFGPRAQALGWVPHLGEREVDSLLRESLLPFVADRGTDAGLRSQADKLARDWLTSQSALGAMLRPILVTAAHFGSADLFDAYLAATEHTAGRERGDLYAALGGFRDPVLLNQALSLALSDRTEARDAWAVLRAAASDPATAAVTLRFVADHYDALLKRLPDTAALDFVRLGASLCDADARRDFETFFGDPAHRPVGGGWVLAESLESVDLCIASRDAQVQSLRSFFASPRFRS